MFFCTFAPESLIEAALSADSVSNINDAFRTTPNAHRSGVGLSDANGKMTDVSDNLPPDKVGEKNCGCLM